MAKFRILQLITTLERAGAQSLLVNLCRSLDPNQFEITIAYLRGRADILSSSTEPFTVLDLSDNGRFSLLAPGRVLRLLRSHDLLHTHLVHASLMGLSAARLAGLRATVYTRHHTAGPRRRLDYRLEARLSRTAKGIIAVSSAIRDDLVQTGADPARVQVISNGIDVESFANTGRERRRDTKSAGPIIGTVARLEPQKSIHTLLETFRLVLGELPESTLEIVGEGREQEQLESLAGQLGIENRVRFLGALPHSDIPARLAGWDIFALTSRQEPFGIVAAEAMAAGVPVVVSDIGGLREVITHEVTGLTFPVGSSHDAAEAIIRVWKDNSLRTQLTAAASAEVRKRYDIRTCAARHATLYRQIQQVASS